VVVLAGDIHTGLKGIAWARKYFRDRPIVHIPGNHEYYGRELIEHLEAMRASGRKLGVDVLDGDELVLGGVRFLGATAGPTMRSTATARPSSARCSGPCKAWRIIR
jgi:hypothetical protein